MLGLLLLRHYNARALTWPPLLWWETGLLLLLIAFSLSTAGPLFQPWAAEILQKGGRRSIREVLYLFPGAGPLFQPWAAEILQKGAPQLDLNVASISASTCFFFGAGKVHCFFARGSRCATTMQGLELDLRFCEGKLDCFFCWSASPYLPLDPFSSRERPRSSKKGRRNLTSNVVPFGSSQCLCHTQRLYHRQLSRFLPSVLVGLSGLLSFGRSLSRNTVRNKVCRAHLSHQVGLAQLVEQMTLNLKVKASTPAWGMCLSFLLAFACTVVSVLLLEGKCIASLQEDPAEDSLYLACFYCATTVQGLELDLRFCDGKLDCFFCCTASPYLPLDPFLSRERARSFKKGPTATSAQTFTFFQALDPFLRPERPTSSKKGATATSAQTFAFFQALDPLLSRERPRSSKKGRRNLTSNVLPFGSSQCLCHT